MVAVNITNGKLIWATPFVAHGTVLDVTVPDTHDWDTSWGSSISKVTLPNRIEKKVVIGHDKMGNVIAMDAETGQEIWWKTLGEQYRTHVAPSPNGTGMVWSYGVYNYHAVDNDTLYVSATNRGLNFFTDGISGHKISAPKGIEQGLVNGTIMALDLVTGGHWTKKQETNFGNSMSMPNSTSWSLNRDGMLFVPTSRIQGLVKEGSVQGSVVALGLP